MIKRARLIPRLIWTEEWGEQDTNYKYVCTAQSGRGPNESLLSTWLCLHRHPMALDWQQFLFSIKWFHWALIEQLIICGSLSWVYFYNVNVLFTLLWFIDMGANWRCSLRLTKGLFASGGHSFWPVINSIVVIAFGYQTLGREHASIPLKQ